MSAFTVYPAIDLRAGKVVRLSEGDPQRQTVYGYDPAAAARRWLDGGAAWLHAVNLDGAFGEEDQLNRAALEAILAVTASFTPQRKVQFGGGLRSMDALRLVFKAGVSRAVLGTAAVESPGLVQAALQAYGPERIAVGIDARDGIVRLRGWKESSGMQAIELAAELAQAGLRIVIFTNIARDGLGGGVDLDSTATLAKVSGLEVIASGGIHSVENIRRVRQAGLAGVIVGRALYERSFTLQEALTC